MKGFPIGAFCVHFGTFCVHFAEHFAKQNVQQNVRKMFQNALAPIVLQTHGLRQLRLRHGKLGFSKA